LEGVETISDLVCGANGLLLIFHQTRQPAADLACCASTFGVAPNFVLEEHRIGAEKTFQRGNQSWPGS
jgi:hypothetical protein